MFKLRHIDEPVDAFHQRTIDEVVEPAIWIPRLPPHPVLVLGSRQQDDVVDRRACEQRGVSVVRRRSGGGAVLVDRDHMVWFDVVLPREHQGWHDDVGRSFDWIGAALLDVLASLGIEGSAHRGALVNTTWSDLVCFAGLGPGEITVEGRKVVGISQRRTRYGARFQVAILQQWDPTGIVELLELRSDERDSAASALATVATGLARTTQDIVSAVAETLGAESLRP